MSEPPMPEAAARFLSSPEGRAVVRGARLRAHLPATVEDDLAQEVLRRLCATDADRLQAVDNLAALVTTVARRAAVDLVRGRVRGPQEVVRSTLVDPDAEVRVPSLDGASPLDVEADVVGGALLAEIRRRVLAMAGDDPARAAAALAYLAITCDGAVPGDGCPRPAGGASPDEAAAWAALWYAGHRDCFTATPTVGAAAVRKRRSRRTGRLRALLRDVAAAVGLDREGAHHG
ncbi:MAG: hypothetical protein FWJ72_10450 [Acidimicrobiia bacterium]